MEIIGVTSLGVELNELTSNSATGFVELYNRLLHQSPLGQLIWVVNSFIPIRNIVPLEANRSFVQNQADLRALLRNRIQERMSEMNEKRSKGTTTESRDLLTYMLEEAHLHEELTGQRPWSEDDIIGHVSDEVRCSERLACTNYSIATQLHICRYATQSTHHTSLLTLSKIGHETAATMLTWSLYVLATRHDVQEKLRAETQAALLAQPTKSDYDQLSTLPYLNNFCREVLRVYPPGKCPEASGPPHNCSNE
jgi:cytochrome P450